MIYLCCSLHNPWWIDRFKNIKTWDGATFISNKYWEIQVLKHNSLLRFEFGFTIREDHAGINLELGLAGYEIHFTIYDNRHWDEENKCYHKDNHYVK